MNFLLNINKKLYLVLITHKEGVLIDFPKQYTQQDYIYDFELKERISFDTIRPLNEKKIDSLYYHYKIK